MPSLDEIAIGFRERYLDYGELTAQLRSWVRAFPEVARLDSLGRTPGGRELWLLTIGPDVASAPDRVRPAVWVDGNMHASELCGSSATLAIAEDALRIHAGEPVHDLPDHVLDVLREVSFHLMPRVSPDGAESAKTLSWNEPVWIEARTDGCALVDPDDARREIGHLAGWGRGKYGDLGTLNRPVGRGSASRRTVSWHVRGSGALLLRTGSCRVGWLEARVEVGG